MGKAQTVPASSLSKIAKVWYHFLVSRLIPSQHYSDVTKGHLKLLYALVKKKKMDLGALLHTEIVTTI